MPNDSEGVRWSAVYTTIDATKDAYASIARQIDHEYDRWCLAREVETWKRVADTHARRAAELQKRLDALTEASAKTAEATTPAPESQP